MSVQLTFLKGYILNNQLLVFQSDYQNSNISIIDNKEFQKLEQNENKLFIMILVPQVLSKISKPKIKLFLLAPKMLFFINEKEKVIYSINFRNNEFKEIVGGGYDKIYSIAIRGSNQIN